jgi:hypothetical protein
MDESLNEVKRKATELLRSLEFLRFDESQTWSEMLRIYSLASSTLKELQDRIPMSFNHFALAPDYKTHEDKELLPRLLNIQCREDVVQTRSQALELHKRELAPFSDGELEVKMTHFNKVCRGMQSLFKTKNSLD